ncbi:Alcohol dehydrogenase, class V [Handroanthus impetiginosus]|uniref:Alcohol dehydrogenase, class V n=1 Tax=Handroanthus impetiginosus TaxID=429701 RepID=A0A2G9G470_9LAMI|nr:Alcohol dehydrogenase, class V [Handroanthus impetiginosus]
MAQGVKAFGWAARDTSGVLSPYEFTTRPVGERDVKFKVLYCGICHSDLHIIRNDWGFTQYPVVPGHEIVGEVTEVGSKVQKVKIGSKVGVGGLVGSCRQCDQCSNNLESYCPQPQLTFGGFANVMVVDEDYLIRWPENFPLDRGAPLLCSGITTYSPLRYYGLDKPGQHIGVVGLGGLGHVAVKFAKAFGAKVTVISSSPNKKKEAIESLGADAFLVSRNQEELQAGASTLDGIIDTVSASHPIQPLLGLLKPHGKLVVVGAADKFELPVFPLVSGRKMVGGSMTGGIKETQEMVDFAAKHNVLPEVEFVPIDYVNTAMERLEKGDVKYRFVIEVAKTLKVG